MTETRTETFDAFGAAVPITYRPETADGHVINEVFGQRLYDLTAYDWWPRVVVPEHPLVVDAGGHIGCAAVWFAHMLPGARVMTLEPEEENFRLLERNTKLAGRSHIEPVRAALASQRCWASIWDPGKGTWGYRTGLYITAAPGRVPALPMSAGPDAFLAKIDIEGSEAELFSANTEWVDRTPFILIEEHDWMVPGCCDNWRRVAEEKGRHQIDGQVVLSVRRDVWEALR